MADPKLKSLQTQTKSEPLQSQKKENTEVVNNLTEKVIAELEEKLNKELEMTEADISTQMSQIDALAAGHEKEIEALKLRDDALAERDAEIAKSDLEMEKSRFEIESIKTVIDNLILKRTFQEKDKVIQEKRKEKLKKKWENARENAEKYAIRASKYASNDTMMSNFIRERCETKLKKLADEVNEINEELKTVEKNIQTLQQAIDATNEKIITSRNTMKEKSIALKDEELKNKRKKETQASEKAGAQGAMPDWYTKYKTAESALNEAKKQQISTREKIDNNAARVSSMRKVVLYAEDESEKEVLISDEGEVYGDTTGVEEGARAVAEKQKVTSQIRNLEVFKVINQDTIPEFLKYNPETGDKFGEDEAVKSDVSFDRSIEQLGDLAKEFYPAIQEIIDSPKLAKFEEFFHLKKRPLQGILKALISDKGVSAALKKITEFREFVMSDKYRRENPFRYNVAVLIVEKLGDCLDMSEKGEYSDSTFYSSLSSSLFVPQVGNSIGGFISTLVGTFDTKTMGAMIGGKILSLSGVADDVVDNAKDVIKGAATGFEEGLQAYYLSKEIDAWKNQSNPQAMRILEAAKRARINNSVNGFIDTGASATKMILANGKGLGKILSWTISGVSAGIQFLVGKGFEKYDKSALLNSPEVFGSLHYDTKLISDEKFDILLKNATGITSKDKVYSAIKTTDAISIHQRMIKSLIKPDYEVERLLSGLGYQDRSMYHNIRITDIMKKTGHAAAGGDWRRELKDALLVEGKDYRTLLQSVGDGVERGYGYAKTFGRAVVRETPKSIKNGYYAARRRIRELDGTYDEFGLSV